MVPAYGIINIEHCDGLFTKAMAQFDGIVINVWKIERFTRKVVEHNNLRLIEARVPVMGSTESGGTSVIRYKVNILKALKNGSISSPQYGYRYLSKMVPCQWAIKIVRCDRVMHKGDGRMHFREALMHDEIEP